MAFEIAKFSLVQDEAFRLSDDRRYFGIRAFSKERARLRSPQGG